MITVGTVNKALDSDKISLFGSADSKAKGHAMRCDPERLPAWSFEDAACRTLALGIFREYKTAQKQWETFRSSFSLGHVGQSLNGGSRYVDSKLERFSNRRNTAIRYCNEGLIDQFVLGRLVTYGREGSPLAELKLIPASAWRDMRICDWGKFRAATRRPKVVIHDVRIYPALVAPNAIDHLAGTKLAAAILNLIFSDPLIDTLRGFARGKPLELDRRRADSHFLWSIVRPIKNCQCGLRTASSLANLVLGLRVAELIEYLSTGQIVALGMINGVVEVVPLTVWDEVGVYLDLNSGTIFRLTTGTEAANVDALQPLYTDLILSRPDQISSTHVKPIVPVDVRSTTIKVEPKLISKAITSAKKREGEQEECRVLFEEIIGASPKRTHTKKELVMLARFKCPDLSETRILELMRDTIKKLNAHAWRASGAPEKSPVKKST